MATVVALSMMRHARRVDMKCILNNCQLLRLRSWKSLIE